jgi:hypothetical protein
MQKNYHTEETKQKLRDANTIHGHNINHCVSRTYKSWSGMKDRCLNPNDPSWNYYGGRGITIYKDWLGCDGFKHFLDDMGERPEGMTLDRRNTNGNYEPLNCRWADSKTQQQNRRNKDSISLVLIYNKEFGFYPNNLT